MRVELAGTYPPFNELLQRAVENGVKAVALVDRDGVVVARAGEISAEEAMPLAALVMYRLKAADLASRLFAGETISVTLDDRDVAVAVAKRQLFIVAVLEAATDDWLALVRDVRDDVERMLTDATADIEMLPPWGGSGGSGSGPAELPLIELGITVSRTRGKA
jgi:predicted regulator of Ras-like GTPase activity (Roadblock/LC7/MglB family)